MTVEYENSYGQVYFLQRPEDKDDPEAYFFSSEKIGVCVDKIPSGYKIHEDLENEVFLVPENDDLISREEVSIVEDELAKIGHLNEYEGQYRVKAFGGSTRVYILDQTPEAIADVVTALPEESDKILENLSEGNFTYSAHMKFSPGKEKPEMYYVDRRMFSGIHHREEEKWIYVGNGKNLRNVARKYLPHLEKDSFFELGL